MICTKCNIKSIEHKTLKLCGDCCNERKKELRVANSYKYKWSNLPKEKRKMYAKNSMEVQRVKAWLGGKPKKNWYCTWPDKFCHGCSHIKHRYLFGKDISVGQDGTSSRCKDCNAVESREYKRRLGPKAPCITSVITCECMREIRRGIKYKNDLVKSVEKRYAKRGIVWGKRCDWPDKKCNTCGEYKPREDFTNITTNKDNKGCKCSKCRGVGEGIKTEVTYEEKRALANTKKKKRALAEKLAKPRWLSKRQKEEIKYIYNQMRDCRAITGERYEVNHIVPLRGEKVCGLHVPWNLEVLPKDINLAISNRFDGGW